MPSLHLSPLPSLRSDDKSDLQDMGDQAFVDDAVILALVAGATAGRQGVYEPADLVLAADDQDFAGWSLPPAPPAKAVKSRSPRKTSAPAQRPAPPVSIEPGLGQPHCGSHRWWLAGLAGALSTLLFSVLLLSLSARISTQAGPAPTMVDLINPPPAAPSGSVEPSKLAPHITGVSP